MFNINLRGRTLMKQNWERLEAWLRLNEAKTLADLIRLPRLPKYKT